MEYHIKCELIGKGFSRYFKLLTCLLLLYTTHTSIHAIMYYCYCSLYPCIPCGPLQNYQNILYLVAIVHYTHLGPCTTSFEDLVTLHRERYSRYLGRGSAMASFGNSWPENFINQKAGPSGGTRGQHKLCLDDTHHHSLFSFFCFIGLRNRVVVDIIGAFGDIWY